MNESRYQKILREGQDMGLSGQKLSKWMRHQARTRSRSNGSYRALNTIIDKRTRRMVHQFAALVLIIITAIALSVVFGGK